MNAKRLLLIATMTLAVSTSPVFAMTETVDGITWTYTVSGGKASVGGGALESPAVPTSTSGAIVIPDMLGGYPVTSIGDGAFYECSGLTSIAIPYGVTGIGSGAFGECTSLASIHIPYGVTRIADAAFYECTVLGTITIPHSVALIDKWAFYGCNSLVSIAIPEALSAQVSQWELPSGCEVTFLPTEGEGTETVNGVEWSYGFYSDYDGDYAWITSVPTATSGAIDIPSTLGGCRVVDIAVGAFQNCTAIASITIPKSVEYIEDDAFSGCSGMTFVMMPNSVTDIGASAFRNCSSLFSVTIPDSVTNVGNSVFFGCTKLVFISIPEFLSQRTNRWGLRYDCKIYYSETVDGIAWCYTVMDGNASVGTDGTIYEAPRAVPTSTTGAITVPSVFGGHPVTIIGDCAFDGCVGLTSIAIPYGVTSIGDYAFADCTGLTSITIPHSVTNMGNNAFQGCTSLTSITEIVDGMEWSYHISNREAFVGKNSSPAISTTTVGAIAIPSTLGGCPVKGIGDGAFSDCSGLTSIAIPTSVTNIAHTAFYGCSGLRDVVVPGQFELSRIFPSSISASITNAVVAEGSTSIGWLWAYGCTNLTAVTIPNSVTNIGYYAFRNCTNLTSVTIPNSVTAIGDYAFENCRGLTSITIPNSVTNIGEHAFSDCTNLTSVTIPNSVTAIGYSAFRNCWSLTSIEIPEALSSQVSRWDLPGSCEVLVAGVLLDGTYTRIVDGIPWTYTAFGGEVSVGSGRYSSIPSSTAGAIVIPSSLGGCPVTGIGRYAFSDCYDLTSITIPSSVTNIGNYAFEHCGLTNITISASVTSIGNGAFYRCGRLTSIVIPDSVRSIGWDAFRECRGLTSLTIPDGVIISGYSAFEDCPLETILIKVLNPASWATNTINSVLPYRTHYYVTSTNTISRKLIVAGDEVTEFVVSDEIRYIGNAAFANCIGLSSVTIPHSVTNIANDAFYGCTGLTSITIPNSVTSVGSYAFSGCTGLKSVTIPGSVTGIGSSAFYRCTGLTSIVIPDGVTSIDYDAFRDCSGLTSIVIPDSVTDIGSYAFYGSGLKWIVIPDALAGQTSSWCLPSGCEIVLRSSLAGRTTPDGVPHEWFYHYGAFLDAADGDCDDATQLSAANGVNKVWQCYVAGISPVDEDARFEAKIEMVDGTPRISWYPDLNESGTKRERVYTVEGKAELTDSWGPTNNLSRFFHVKVGMPE